MTNKVPRITIVVGGDFFPSCQLEPSRREDLGADIWGGIEKEFRAADLSIVNLETPLTDSDAPIAKTGPHIKASPRSIELISSAGIKLLTLANNHIFDYGQRGIDDTLSLCAQSGIATVGAGRTLSEAQRTHTAEITGKRFAVINFAENEWGSASARHGGANPMDMVENARQIREARESADIVLVIVHGGIEHYPYPSPETKKRYRFFVDMGADAVIGHHTHCVSGYEVYNGTPIFYSIGNLFFPAARKKLAWYEGMLVRLQIDPHVRSVDFDLIPYHQCKEKMVIMPMAGEEKERFFAVLTEKCRVISNDALLMENWREFVATQRTLYRSWILVPWTLLWRGLNKFGLLRFVRNRAAERLAANLIRCEAHREVLLDSLKGEEKP